MRPASIVKIKGARIGDRLFPSKDAHRAYSGHIVMARMAAQPKAGRKSPPTQIAGPTSTIVSDVRAIIRACELKGSGSATASATAHLAPSLAPVAQTNETNSSSSPQLTDPAPVMTRKVAAGLGSPSGPAGPAGPGGPASPFAPGGPAGP